MHEPGPGTSLTLPPLQVPVPPRDFTSSPRMIIIRSFDVNHPGEEACDLKGGVAGGSILSGVLRVGDEVEVRPGIVSRDSEGRVRCSPINSRIVSLKAEANDLQYAVPGGLIGVGLQVDPTLTRADRLVGQVLGHRGQLPEIFVDIEVAFYLLRRLLGVKTGEGEKAAKVAKLTKAEMLMVNIGSTSTGGRVVGVKGETARIALTQPVCTQEDEKIALSRRIEGHWRYVHCAPPPPFLPLPLMMYTVIPVLAGLGPGGDEYTTTLCLDF